MALKKPIVLDTAGDFQQLQSGDTIDTQPDRVSATFTSITLIGQVVYVDGNNSVDLAQANAAGTSISFGMASVGVGAAGTADVIIDGIVSATTGEWDAITGDAGGLTAGTKYFMSAATAGNITTTAPISVGQFVAEIGVGVSTTELEFTRHRRILL